MANYIRVSAGYGEWLKLDKCDGCGSGWNAKLVPDTIFGMSITDCCCPHDYDYFIGMTIEDKQAADRRLKNNIYRKISHDTKWWRNNRFIKSLMRHRARVYYEAVKEFGAEAFWHDKKNGEEVIIIKG